MPVFLITGANRGIGLELCNQLSQDQNNKVIACCRTVSKELDDLSNNHNSIFVISNIDISKPESLIFNPWFNP